MDQGSSRGSVKFGEKRAFNGVKVFSATMMQDRDQLGEVITAWISRHPTLDLTEIIVTQSSDESFHCLAMTLFYYEPIDS